MYFNPKTCKLRLSYPTYLEHQARSPVPCSRWRCNVQSACWFSSTSMCNISTAQPRPHSQFVQGDFTGPSATNRRTSNMITNKALFHRVAVQIKWMLCSARRAPCPPPPPCGRALTIHDLPPAQDMPVVRWFPLHMCRFASANLKIANRRILFISNNCL